MPVLNERQSAILGLCAERAATALAISSLTFDHRMSDGMRAARFPRAAARRGSRQRRGAEHAPCCSTRPRSSSFFVVVFALYWLLRARTPQNVLLLAAS